MYVQPRPAVRQTPRRNWIPWLFAGSALIAGVLMLVAVIGFIGIYYMTQDRIQYGVMVAGHDLSQKTAEQAEEYLSQQLASSNFLITAIDHGTDRSWPITAHDLGISMNVNVTVTRALAAGQSVDVAPHYAIDLHQATQALIDLSTLTNIEARPGRPPIIGRDLDIEYMIERLRVDVTGEVSDSTLDLTMVEVQPPEISALEAYTGARTSHVVEPGQELALIAKEYGVTTQDIVALNALDNADLIFAGQELVIPAAGVYVPNPEVAPPAPLAQGKSILVSTSEQRIYAYEDGHLIHTHITSTGRSETPTVKGDFNIYVKFEADDMSGPDYFLPQVPWTMYFHRGYAIHGTYWHNSFGRPMSHGCVNLPTEEAEWFFNWAEVGTLVRVI